MTLGDFEHIEPVELYHTKNSMREIANMNQRSSSTISAQLRDHNQRVERMGYCIRCKRTGSSLFNQIVKRSRFRGEKQ